MIYRVCRCDTRPGVRGLMIEKKYRIFKPLLESKAKPSPPEQSVKFECKITKKLAKKCRDASSL